MNEYTFFALRYVHDAVTQEFANVGIVLYAEGPSILRAKFTTQYRRLSGMFGGGVDGEGFRSAVRYIQSQLEMVAGEIESSMFPAGDLRAILARVLPPDASALQFHPVGGGLSRDLDESLQVLYARHVSKYAERGQSEGDDVAGQSRGASHSSARRAPPPGRAGDCIQPGAEYPATVP